MTGETERALRAITCEGCKSGAPIDAQGFHNYGELGHPCTSKHAELLPLFNAGIAGAYAAAAKHCMVPSVFGSPKCACGKFFNHFFPAAIKEWCDHILALTPADARHTETERMSCGHLKADWVEAAHVWHQGPCVLGCTKAHCLTCTAIASAEARARLEEMEWLWRKDFGDAYNGGYLNERGRELLLKRMAAARTPY